MKTIYTVIALCAFAIILTLTGKLSAQPFTKERVPASAATLEQRVADLEAYVNNTKRLKDTTTATSIHTTHIPGAGPGHNAWLMVSALLVLFMTLPGLALFYGGLVRAKNVLSIMAQCFAIAGVVSILWWAIGYSLVFSEGNSFFGGVSYAFFNGVDSSVGQGGQWVSNNVFAMFQMMFAIITPALIVGAIAERMKLKSVLLFVTIWMFVVYFPLAHMVWGPGGFMNGLGNFDNAGILAIDFAGGTVVHMSSGWSALVLCLILGRRSGFNTRTFTPHSLVLTSIGTGMLWVGWYGFNAGSALAADNIAAVAFTSTTLAAAVAGLVWASLDWLLKGHPTVLGFCSGVVAGLVIVTPAAGFITPSSAILMGLLGGALPYFAVVYFKKWLGFDDALDTFGIHGVGGTLGALFTPLLSSANVNPALTNLIEGHLFIENLKAVGLTVVLSILATTIIAYAIKILVGLRVTLPHESIGLDIGEHREEGYSGLQTFVE